VVCDCVSVSENQAINILFRWFNLYYLRVKTLLFLLSVLAVSGVSAQVSTLTSWTSVFHGTSTGAQNSVVNVPAGSGTYRCFVVAIATGRTSVGSRTVTLTYGGQTFTSVAGDIGSATPQQHTQLYYLDEAGIEAASNTTFSVTVSGGATRMTDVWYAIYDFVDQVTPITDSKTYSSGTSTTTNPVFSSALTVNANNLAVEVISCHRTGSTFLRNITYATNWTMSAQQTSTATDAIRNAVAERTIPTSNTTDVSSTTFSGTALGSMTAMTLNAIPQIYRSNTASVTWSTPAHWQQSGDAGATWATATTSPTSSDGMVTILSGHTVTLTGPETVSDLSINAGGALALSSFTLTSTASLTLECGASSGASISGAGVLTLGGDITVNNAGTGVDGATISCPVSLGANRQLTVADDGTAAADLTMSGVVSGSGFGITKVGTGTLILSGANTYTGAVIINDGILSINTIANASSTSALGTGAGTPAITISGTGTLQYTGTGHSSNRAFILSGSGATIEAAGSGTLTLSGGVTGSGFGLFLTGSGDGLMSGVIGTGAGTLTKMGTGTWIYSGTNTYTGLTTISAGTLQASNSNKLATGNVTIDGPSAVWDLNTTSESVGTITLRNGGSITGTTNSLTSTGSFEFEDGTVSKILAGSVPLNKTTTGTVILSGVSTFSGAVNISGGTLQSGAANVLPGVTVTVSDGATLDLNGFSDVIGALNVNSGSVGGTVTTGAGTLTLGGNVTSTGGASNALIAGNLSLANSNRTFTITNANDGLLITAVISSTGASGALTTAGAGTLTLSGLNTFSGRLTIGGTSVVSVNTVANTGVASSLGTGSGTSQIRLTRGTTLLYTGTGHSSNRTIALRTGSGNAVIDASGSGALTFSGAISGNTFPLELTGTGSGELSGVIGTSSGTLTKSGSGTWTLSATNTYTGATTINAGVLNIQNNQGTGTAAGGVTVASGATLELEGGITVGTESLSLDDVGVGSAGALRNMSGANTWGGTITLTTNAVRINSDAGSLTLSASNAITATNIDLTMGGAGDINVTGTITTGSGTLTKYGVGVLTLSGANTYTGLTTISAGVLKLGVSSTSNAAGPLGTTGSGTIVTAGAALDLNGFSLTSAALEALSLSGTGISSGGALANGSGTTSTYEGVITFASDASVVGGSGLISITGTPVSGSTTITLGGAVGGSVSTVIAGARNIIKEDAGTWTLSGSSTYSGSTTVNAGTLKAGVITNAFGSASAIVMANISGAILDITGFDNTIGSLTGGGGTGGNITLGAATLTIGSNNTSPAAYAGIISGTGAITKQGTGTLTLSGANTYTGVTTISAGVLKLGASSSSSASGPLGTNAGGVVVSSGAALDLGGFSYTSTATEPLSISGTGISNGGAITNSSGTTSTYIGVITFTSAASIVGDAGLIAITGTPATGTTGITLGGTAGGSVSTIIAGARTLTKEGTGTWTLSGANTYTGATTVSAGTLKAGVATNAFGSASAVTLANTSGATLDITGFSNTIGSLTGGGGSGGNITLGAATLTIGTNNSSPAAYGGVISGTGAISKSGSGSLTLSGANTYTGGTTLSAGTLNINHTSALGASGTFTITGGSIDNTSAGNITTNSYSLALNGDFTYVGSVPRTLNIGTGTVTMNASRQITVSAGTLTIGGILNDNTKNLTKAGSGTLSFGSQSVTLNNLTITSGTLVSTSGTLGILGTLSNSGTFTHNSGTVNFNQSGAQNVASLTYNNLTCSNTGTKTASGDLTVNGTLTVAAATVLDMTSAYTLTGTLGTISNSGTIQTAVPTATSATPLATGKTWNGQVTYSATTGLQTISSGTYSNLTLSNTSATNTMGGAMTVGGLLTLSGGKLALGSNTITLNGTLSGMTASSSFTADGSSALVINGSGALGSNLFMDQTTPGTTNRLTNFTYNRSSQTITLGDTLEITGTLTPTAGTLATSDKLKLISNSSGTARVAAGTGAYISGNVVAERYIPALSRRWRFLGSPITNGTLADWQNEIYITGVGGAANGFDVTLSNYAGVYTYDETPISGDLNTGWTAATNISNALTVGKGFRVFIRGDRSDPGRLTGTTTSQNEVTMNLIGPLNIGDIVMPVTFTSSGNVANDGWNFVSNPYASDYDWNAFYDAENGGGNCTNIDPTVYIFDANSNGYKSYNAVSNAGTLTGGIIPSSGGFWVKANAAAPSLTLTETYKTASTPIGVFKTNEGEGFKIRIEADSISYDEMVVKYLTGSTVNKDVYDIRKLPTAWVNISAYGNDMQYLSASVRPPSNTNDTIKLGVYASTSGTYTLRFYNSNEIAIQENVLLYDTYTSTVTDLLTTNEYVFTVTSSIAATQGDNRFYIVVANNTGLPVSLLTFGAQAQPNQTVRVSWSTIQEVNNDHFEVERSVDGLHFTTIGNVHGKGTAQKLNQYMFVDEQPARLNYYRLKQVDYDGSLYYSKVVQVNLNEVKQTEVTLYPVPAITTLTVSQAKPIQSIAVYDLEGSVLFTKPVSGNQTTLAIESLSPGTYILQIEDENGLKHQEKFVKQ
jgi:autotransporter-associated beta strand protein